jgi:hypothetical protein
MKRLISFLSVLILLAFILNANAAVKVGTFGYPDSSGTYPMEVDSDSVITVDGDATLTINSTIDSNSTMTAESIAIGTTAVRQSSLLDVDGKIYLSEGDSGIYGSLGGDTRIPSLDLNIYGASNPIRILTNEAERVRITAAGNVGVGTTVPKAMFHVGNAGTPTYAAITATNDAYVTGDVEVDGKLYVDTSLYVPSIKATTGNRFVCIDSQGYVISLATTCGAGT